MIPKNVHANTRPPALPDMLPGKSRPWWDYPKLRFEKVKVLLVRLGHLLSNEIQNSLTRLGHEYRVISIGGSELSAGSVEWSFTKAIKDFRPDFVLTINHSGFDHEGIVTGLLTRYRIPFASWYVDSPHLIIRHYASNKSPYLTLFLWDSDYIEIVEKLGFKDVEYLPLGVDEAQFRPVRLEKNPLGHLSSKVSFVGNSMVIKSRTRLARCGVQGPLKKRFLEISSAFEKTHHLVIRDFLNEQFPDLAGKLMEIPEPQALGYETSVTWHATGRYRWALVRRLKPFEPLIIGDKGWNEILDNGFRHSRELNYYSELPFFYNVSHVSFNATSRQMKQGVNQRVFDVPACKGVLITDWTKQLENLMEPGSEIIAYKEGDEIPGLVEKALKDSVYHRSVALAGHRRVLGEHTYCHRLTKMIEVLRKKHA